MSPTPRSPAWPRAPGRRWRSSRSSPAATRCAATVIHARGGRGAGVGGFRGPRPPPRDAPHRSSTRGGAAGGGGAFLRGVNTHGVELQTDGGEPGGYAPPYARLGTPLGSKKTGATLYELP